MTYAHRAHLIVSQSVSHPPRRSRRSALYAVAQPRHDDAQILAPSPPPPQKINSSGRACRLHPSSSSLLSDRAPNPRTCMYYHAEHAVRRVRLNAFWHFGISMGVSLALRVYHRHASAPTMPMGCDDAMLRRGFDYAIAYVVFCGIYMNVLEPPISRGATPAWVTVRSNVPIKKRELKNTFCIIYAGMVCRTVPYMATHSKLWGNTIERSPPGP